MAEDELPVPSAPRSGEPPACPLCIANATAPIVESTVPVGQTGLQGESHERSQNEALDRCIFCHAASGEQYVAVHYAPTGGVLTYSSALRGHSACAACWHAWEKRCMTQGKKGIRRTALNVEITCPVCQRTLDVRHAYEDGPHCGACMQAIVLKAPPLPRSQAARAHGRWSCCLIMMLVMALVNIIVMMSSFALDIVLEHAFDRVAELPDEYLHNAVPPGFRDVLCPLADLAMEFVIPGTPGQSRPDVWDMMGGFGSFGSDMLLQQSLRFLQRVCGRSVAKAPMPVRRRRGSKGAEPISNHSAASENSSGHSQTRFSAEGDPKITTLTQAPRLQRLEL